MDTKVFGTQLGNKKSWFELQGFWFMIFIRARSQKSCNLFANKEGFNFQDFSKHQTPIIASSPPFTLEQTLRISKTFAKLWGSRMSSTKNWHFQPENWCAGVSGYYVKTLGFIHAKICPKLTHTIHGTKGIRYIYLHECFISPKFYSRLGKYHTILFSKTNRIHSGAIHIHPPNFPQVSPTRRSIHSPMALAHKVALTRHENFAFGTMAKLTGFVNLKLLMFVALFFFGGGERCTHFTKERTSICIYIYICIHIMYIYMRRRQNIL